MAREKPRTGQAGKYPVAPRHEGPEEPRIVGLDLRTAAPLDEMKGFYGEMLGMRVEEESAERLAFLAGRTRIVFRRDGGEEEDPPFYHVAFNIPENKLFQARRWQLERTRLLRRPEDDFSHPDHPDVTRFRHWNAHSVFFADPAGNLLEYVARHDLPNAAPGPFTARDVLYVSEIGLVAEDVPAFGQALESGTGVRLYYAAGDSFRAYGDPNGLLIVLQHGVPSWANRRRWATYETGVTIRAGRRGRFAAEEYPYTVEMEPG